MARIGANDPQTAASTNVPAVHANLFDGCFDFHDYKIFLFFIRVGRFVICRHMDQAGHGHDLPQGP